MLELAINTPPAGYETIVALLINVVLLFQVELGSSSPKNHAQFFKHCNHPLRVFQSLLDRLSLQSLIFRVHQRDFERTPHRCKRLTDLVQHGWY
jgi:hypothetical protein